MAAQSALAVVVAPDASTIAPIIRRAADQLASATSAAEVLDARDIARSAYDAAKSAARFARAKSAHDDVIAAVFRAQADALEIEAMAKRRLADEYDAAQERGEVATRADQNLLPDQKKVSVSDLGLTHKDIHEARLVRDAEAADPGIVHRTVTERLQAGHEPTRTALRGAISEAAMRGLRPPPSQPVRRNPDYVDDPKFRAASAIAGYANTIAEQVAGQGPAFILAGCLDDGMLRRNLATFRAGRDALNQLLEAGHAE